MIEHKKIISAVAVIAVVVIFTNFFIYINGSKIKNKSQTQNLGLEQLEQHMAVGVVEKISGQEITLNNAKKIPENTTSGVKSESLVVIVDQATTIERFVGKDTLVFQKELEDFAKKQKESQNTNTPVMPPEPFTRVKIGINDIKAGDTIVVFSTINIKKLTSFTAKEINVQPTRMATSSR